MDAADQRYHQRHRGPALRERQLGFAAATGAILLRTTDAGANWTPLTTPITYNMRGIHFFDAQNGIAVGLGGEIIRTTDGGDNWTLEPSPTTNSLLSLFVQGNVLIAMGNGGTVIRSTNGGVNWTAQTLDLQDLYSAWIDPSGIGLLTGKARVYRTLNFGATWTAVQIGTYHTMLNKVSFGTEQNGASAGWQTMGGLENGVVRTTDGGRSWSNASAGNSQWLGVHLLANGTGWLGGGVGANKSTTDFFATSVSHPGPDVAIRCTWAFDATTAVVGGGYINGGCYRTTNAGATWEHTLDGGNIYDLWFVNDTLGFCGGEGGGLARTHDGGITWEWLDSGSNADIYSIFFLNDTLGYFAGSGGARTTDGGDTWTFLGNLPQYTMSIFFTDPDTGYAVSVSGYALRTTNGGDDWTYVVPEPFDVLIGDATLVDGALIAVGRYGDVYRAALQCPSTPQVPYVLQSGTTLSTAWRPQIQWYLEGIPIPNATWPYITATEPGSYTVVVTDALGCISAPSVPVVVISTAVEEQMNDAFAVFPNPTTGLLTLSFAKDGPHTVLLCDAQGRVLRNERMSGATAMFDLHELPAGLYIVREAGSAPGVRVVRE
ncbi:MAG: T9SS type A sorting domain-containing protein [Flavobacteriales bacterium]|nr:T9SS type A sorting domain-containing protein [Flavobacteriales bacterium]